MPRSRPPLLLIAAFAAVYLVWGSSFAVTKFMVHTLPPLLAGGLRFVVAGLLMVAFATWRGAAIPREAIEWRHVSLMALFHVVMSAGVNIVAMPHVASNQSALLNATAALWIPLLGAVGRDPHPLTPRVSIGLSTGFLGAGFLLWPHGGFTLANLGWQLVVVGACFSWALGTRYFRSVRTTTPTVMFFALEMLLGGVALSAAGFAFGEAARWHPDGPSLAALGFLTLLGSCVTYTAFGYLMSRTTPAQLSTYAYVNPAIAALVGWLVLGERMSPTQTVGMAIILAGVVLVSLPDGRSPPRDVEPTEPTG
jgi:drug/metabolite transporter (DMT)-like permease